MPRTTNGRFWLTDKQSIAADRRAEQLQNWRDEHTAKYGDHVCTPDPNDPWSTCDRESTGVIK